MPLLTDDYLPTSTDSVWLIINRCQPKIQADIVVTKRASFHHIILTIPHRELEGTITTVSWPFANFHHGEAPQSRFSCFLKKFRYCHFNLLSLAGLSPRLSSLL